jgi:hypothetical protein
VSAQSKGPGIRQATTADSEPITGEAPFRVRFDLSIEIPLSVPHMRYADADAKTGVVVHRFEL